MRISYKRLFRVQLRHGFYKKSRSTQDFIVKPSPSTAKVLSHHGFIFRSMEDGFSLYARVKPDSQPVELLNSLNEALFATPLLCVADKSLHPEHLQAARLSTWTSAVLL